jgi:hypothetical protein
MTQAMLDLVRPSVAASRTSQAAARAIEPAASSLWAKLLASATKRGLVPLRLAGVRGQTRPTRSGRAACVWIAAEVDQCRTA